MIIDKHIKEITDLVISLHPILSKKDIQRLHSRRRQRHDSERVYLHASRYGFFKF